MPERLVSTEWLAASVAAARTLDAATLERAERALEALWEEFEEPDDLRELRNRDIVVCRRLALLERQATPDVPTGPGDPVVVAGRPVVVDRVADPGSYVGLLLYLVAIREGRWSARRADRTEDRTVAILLAAVASVAVFILLVSLLDPASIEFTYQVDQERLDALESAAEGVDGTPLARAVVGVRWADLLSDAFAEGVAQGFAGQGRRFAIVVVAVTFVGLLFEWLGHLMGVGRPRCRAPQVPEGRAVHWDLGPTGWEAVVRVGSGEGWIYEAEEVVPKVSFVDRPAVRANRSGMGKGIWLGTIAALLLMLAATTAQAVSLASAGEELEDRVSAAAEDEGLVGEDLAAMQAAAEGWETSVAGEVQGVVVGQVTLLTVFVGLAVGVRRRQRPGSDLFAARVGMDRFELVVIDRVRPAREGGWEAVVRAPARRPRWRHPRRRAVALEDVTVVPARRGWAPPGTRRRRPRRPTGRRLVG